MMVKISTNFISGCVNFKKMNIFAKILNKYAKDKTVGGN